VVLGAFGSPSSTKRQGHVLSTIFSTWAQSDGLAIWLGRSVPAIRLTRARVLIPCVVILTYPWEYVGSFLGKGPDLLLHKYKGVRPIENPQTHSNRTNLFTFIYHSCLRSRYILALVVDSTCQSSSLFDSISSRAILGGLSTPR
jgi:hypothetical protein